MIIAFRRSETGQIYTWGDGHKGELGREHDPVSKLMPKPITMQVDPDDKGTPKNEKNSIPLHAFFVKVGHSIPASCAVLSTLY